MKGSDDAFYEAFKSKDTRFDGRFFVGISSTKIYCRPVCRAKQEKRKTVHSFLRQHRQKRQVLGHASCAARNLRLEILWQMHALCLRVRRQTFGRELRQRTEPSRNRRTARLYRQASAAGFYGRVSCFAGTISADLPATAR